MKLPFCTKPINSLLLSLFTLLLFAQITYAAYENTQQFNIAPNPSFEQGITQPDGWTSINGKTCNENVQTPAGQTSWASDQALSGSKSLAIKSINWSGPSGAIPGSWESSELSIQYPQLNYYVMSKVKVDASGTNLSAVAWFCAFDNAGNRISYNYTESFPSRLANDGYWHTIILQIIPNARLSKIVIGLAGSCRYGVRSCSGNLWFDDITIVPLSGSLKVNAFEDSNRNGNQDINESGLPLWEARSFNGFDCIAENLEVSGYGTDENGTVELFRATLAGNYSTTIVPKPGWINTTPICQNVTLEPGKSSFVSFGFIKQSFPYFSQKDLAWGNQEYDSANTYGPFFCGTTIGGCGCAITSSAMLLKYYGVDKAPNGDPTNPATLNNWLKTNNGYAFGALKWNSIASYSVKANTAYGTQKIRFVGVGTGNDTTILNQDLSNNSPPILEEPGHFIVATGQQTPTYTINDPAWENRKTLTAYSNQFLSMRRYEKTNTDLSTIYVSAPAPTSIFIIDSSGKKAGKDPQTGTIYNEISGSFYYLDPTLVNDDQENSLQPPLGSGVQTLAIVNPPAGPYNIQIYNPNGNDQAEFSVYDRNGDISVQNLDQQTFSDQPINFEMNYSPEPGAKIDLTQKIKIDIKPGSDTNPVNLKSNGVIPVAAITETTFDAAQINLSDLTFGPSSAKETHNKIHLEDFDNDGDLDAVLHFKTNALGITETTKELCLFGKTLNGTKFKGCDNITITS